MLPRLHRLALGLALLATVSFAQVKFPSDLVNATKDDWEEINFDYKSVVISDGFPSLLTLADLLKKNPDYKVKIVGHTDLVEGNNKRLALCRAKSVELFLEKYGAKESQMTLDGVGNVQPKIPGQSRAYRPTDVARWMARRVEVFVTDGNGKKVGLHDGSIADAIKGMQQNQGAATQKDCCNEIMARLDNLERLLKDRLDDLDKKIAGLDKGRGDTAKQLADVQRKVDENVPAKQLTDEIRAVKTAIPEEIAKSKGKNYLPVNVNLGSDQNGNITAGVKGNYFAALSPNHGVQLGGDYMYWRDRQEGQFDAGLVNRFGNFQIGGFGSFKYVNIREYDSGGVLGQAAILGEYLFKNGRFGGYGTKAFLNNAVIASRPTIVGPNGNILPSTTFNLRNLQPGSRLLTNTLTETYLGVADTYGFTGATKLIGKTWFEGNFGVSRLRNNDNITGGTGRVVLPLGEHFAFTAEGGVNETLLSRTSTNGRVAFGFLFGNFVRPTTARASGVVPMEVPRVKYELLTRTIRNGNAAPIADAGGDQVGVTAGPITLDGSASYDPDGDPITYLWTQVGGPSVSLTGVTTSRAAFTAAPGQVYTFRLQVTDSFGLSAVARATVTAANVVAPTITRFTANPTQITPGQSSTLTWAIKGATAATIDGIGTVNADSGSVIVSPTATTTYRLTATGPGGLSTVETVTVQVVSPRVTISDFRAVPTTIVRGEASQLSWNTSNASTVVISGVGPVQPNGSVAVSPTTTTTYTLTATGADGTTQQSSVNVVVVDQMTRPRIVNFSASPLTIVTGNASTLAYEVENADSVTISNVGAVSTKGTSDVRPTTTTVYVLSATNRTGTSTAQVTVTVTPVPPQPVTLTNCFADPAVIQRPGDASALKWTTTNATSVVVAGSGPALIGGGFAVRPTANTTYRVTAFGADNSQASCTIDVKIASVASAPTATIAGPAVILTTNRTVTLDGSGSKDPAGLPLTYTWRNIGNRTGLIINPTGSTTDVTLSGPAGDFQFELTVTNSAGVSARAQVTVRYTVPNDPLP